MGMAASQARFLQLTARKSNNEYMGQQINQARTALANKSAGLFEKMLALKPPIPPSSTDDNYYTQGYTFIDPADDLRKKISWDQFEDISEDEFSLTGSVDATYFTDALDNTNTQAVNYTMSGFEYLAASGLDDDEAIEEALLADMTAMEGMADYDKAAFMQDPARSALNVLMGGFPEGFTIPDDAESATVRFVTLEHSAYDPNGDYQIIEERLPALLFFDNRERLLAFNELTFDGSVAIDSYDPDYYTAGSSTVPGPGAASQNYAGDGVTAIGNPGDPPQEEAIIFSAATPTTLSPRVEMGDELAYIGQFDEEAFNDDMNRYEFDKNAYDYQVERINLETAQLQQQDKSLELKLKQIDTDHEAIQTEMEAVQKVIQKNIETTFKTFA